MLYFVRLLVRREDAATSVEYGVLLSVVFCLATSSIGMFGTQLSQLIDRVNTVWESDAVDDGGRGDSSSADSNGHQGKGKHKGQYKGNAGGNGKGNANGQSDGKGNNG